MGLYLTLSIDEWCSIALPPFPLGGEWSGPLPDYFHSAFDCWRRGVFPSFPIVSNFYIFCYMFYLFIFNPHPRICFIAFRERGSGREGGREREGERWARNVDRLPPVRTPTGDQTCNLDMCPERELNLQPFWCTGWRSIQLSHQLGLILFLNHSIIIIISRDTFPYLVLNWIHVSVPLVKKFIEGTQSDLVILYVPFHI